MSDIIDRLQLILATEREAGDLVRLDPVTIAAALERLGELDAQVRLGNIVLMDEYDSISDFLGTLVTFRARKMMAHIGRGAPANMMPAEQQFFADISAAVATLRDAWGLPE